MLDPVAGPDDGRSAAQGLDAPGAVERLFAGLEDAGGLVLAVSGGPDSIALMLLARRWREALARDGRRAPDVSVAAVDHGLRADSRKEAQAVVGWAADAGFDGAVLAWEGEKPAARLQERARRARYALLFSHAARVGARVVATAHHADDQAETILFRLLRGSGPSGLAGMAALRERDGLLHARPLLGCAKAELVALCESEGHPFFLDPSNADPRFARARLRALMPLLDAHGLGREALLRLGRRAARAQAALARQAWELGAAARRDDGALDLSGFAGAPGEGLEEALLRVAGAEIEAVGGAPARLDRLEALTDRLARAIERREPCAATLGGALLKLDAQGILRARRETGRRGA